MKYAEWGKEVIRAEIGALEALRAGLGERFDKAVGLIVKCRGKVIVTGLGKSGHVGKKIAATLASLGTPSFFMHSAEARHGDSGMMRKEDLLLAISNSGATSDVVNVAETAAALGLKIIAVTGRPDSRLGGLADVVLDIGSGREADHLDLAPTASSTATLALGDALAVAAARAKNFTAADFAFFHSGGALGGKAAKKNVKKKKTQHPPGAAPMPRIR